MPGIICVKDSNKTADIETLISRIAQAITHKPWHNECHYNDREQYLALGSVYSRILNPQSPLISDQNNNFTIAIDGEIFGIKGCETENCDNPAFILHKYIEHGEDIIERIYGFFSIIIWDKNKDKIIIANDRFGFKPLYYYLQEKKLMVCSEVKGILADRSIKRLVNDDGVADYFTFGHLLGDKTLFKNIQLVPPASIWIYQNNKLTKKQYWKLEDNFGSFEGTEDEYLEEFNRRLKRSVKRQLRGKYDLTVSLTGGLDSRSIIAAIDHSKQPVYSFTHGIKGCVDLEIAQMVGEKIPDHQHHSYEFNKDFFNNFHKYAKEAIYLSDGMAKLGSVPVIFSRSQENQFAQVELNASGADLTRGWGIKSLLPTSKNHEEFINNCISSYKVQYDQAKLFSPEYYSRIFESPRSSLELFYAGAGQINSIYDKANYFYVLEHIRKLILSGGMLMGNYIGLRLPYWDNDLTELIIKAPPSLLNFQRRIPKYTIENNYPDLARVPIADNNYITSFKKDQFQQLSLHLKDVFDSYTNTYITPYLPPRMNIFRFARPYIDYDQWLRKELRGFMESILLDTKTLNRGYFRPQAVRQIVSDHLARKGNFSSLINLMLGFELWQREFME